MALVIGLILLALFLFFVEFLLIPGVTVAGILGALAMVTGIYLAYHTMGSTAGHITLSLATILSFLIVFFSLRSKTCGLFKVIIRIGKRLFAAGNSSTKASYCKFVCSV